MENLLSMNMILGGGGFILKCNLTKLWIVASCIFSGGILEVA